MPLVIAVVVALVVVAGVVAYVLVGRRRSAGATTPSASGDVAPLGGLEAALDGVMGRDGRPLREKIDAEAAQVDAFRVEDDTGPLLRRALDHVAGDQGKRGDPPSPTGDTAAGEQDAGDRAPGSEPG